MKRNKLKLVWPILLLGSLVLFLCGCVSATATVEGLIPLVSAILGIAGAVGETLLPAEASLIGKGVSLAIGGLNALLAELKDYDANKSGTGVLADLQAAFTATHDTLNQLLAACQVKNQAVTAKLSAAVNGIVSILALLEAKIVSKAPDASASVDAPAPVPAVVLAPSSTVGSTSIPALVPALAPVDLSAIHPDVQAAADRARLPG